MKKLTHRELIDLWAQVENEGFGYYMMYYGPDLNAIEKLGFDRLAVIQAIKLFKDIEKEINKAEELMDEE
jgi:hypothetical protein